MSVPDENLIKFTLLVQRRSQTLIDYHTMLLPSHFIHQTKQARERDSRYDLKVQSITKHFFMKGKQDISSLHEIVCSLVSSSFLLCITKVVAACKVSSVFNHISLSFLQTNFILKREHII